MSSSRDRRLAKELQDIQADKHNSGVDAYPIDEADLSSLRGVITGPPDSPYDKGTFNIKISIPPNYPFAAPSMQFQTKVWHPNVSSQTGLICLDTLGKAWSPVQTIKTALLSIRMLLEFPNPTDPQDAEVATMLVHDPEGFARRAQEWCIKYADAPEQELTLAKYTKETSKVAFEDPHRLKGYSRALVNRFTAMGFAIDDIIEAFIHFGVDRNNGDDYVLDEACVGDIIARLLGES